MSVMVLQHSRHYSGGHSAHPFHQTKAQADAGLGQVFRYRPGTGTLDLFHGSTDPSAFNFCHNPTMTLAIPWQA